MDEFAYRERQRRASRRAGRSGGGAAKRRKKIAARRENRQWGASSILFGVHLTLGDLGEFDKEICAPTPEAAAQGILFRFRKMIVKVVGEELVPVRVTHPHLGQVYEGRFTVPSEEEPKGERAKKRSKAALQQMFGEFPGLQAALHRARVLASERDRARKEAVLKLSQPLDAPSFPGN